MQVKCTCLCKTICQMQKIRYCLYLCLKANPGNVTKFFNSFYSGRLHKVLTKFLQRLTKFSRRWFWWDQTADRCYRLGAQICSGNQSSGSEVRQIWQRERKRRTLNSGLEKIERYLTFYFTLGNPVTNRFSTFYFEDLKPELIEISSTILTFNMSRHK